MNNSTDRIPETKALSKSPESLKIFLFSFSGRVDRSAYWGIFVIYITIGIMMGIFYKVAKFPLVPSEVVLVCMIVCARAWIMLATTAKRLHDIGYSGWFALGALFPCLNLIWLGVVGCLSGTVGCNKYGYGPDPLVALEYNYIHYKAKQGDIGRIESMLAAKPWLVNARGDDGNTPLLGAALGGHKDVVELLVAKGAQVNSGNWDGLAPLHCALKEGHSDVVELLRQHGAIE